MIEALKCWDTLASADKEALLNSLFYTMLYRPVPKTRPRVSSRLDQAVRSVPQLPAPVSELERVEILEPVRERVAIAQRHPAVVRPAKHSDQMKYTWARPDYEP